MRVANQPEATLWPPILAIAAWPAGVIVIVIVVLLLTRGERQPAVLRAIAELVRAVRTALDLVPSRPARSGRSVLRGG